MWEQGFPEGSPPSGRAVHLVIGYHRPVQSTSRFSAVLRTGPRPCRSRSLLCGPCSRHCFAPTPHRRCRPPDTASPAATLHVGGVRHREEIMGDIVWEGTGSQSVDRGCVPSCMTGVGALEDLRPDTGPKRWPSVTGGVLPRTGGYQDPTGLYHFQARYYDANIGRFTQPDPSGQEKNPYSRRRRPREPHRPDRACLLRRRWQGLRHVRHRLHRQGPGRGQLQGRFGHGRRPGGGCRRRLHGARSPSPSAHPPRAWAGWLLALPASALGTARANWGRRLQRAS
ncbi:RHS repeat-associated core domain-containing protein [Streptomyces massasporeus]|uniref:RHS repeat-associated core domain-containing protein n=1 Tax=Streptomyces massasporeus TaxID=67324 RepID=UPI00369E3A63